jgi:hypothetical protein
MSVFFVVHLLVTLGLLLTISQLIVSEAGRSVAGSLINRADCWFLCLTGLLLTWLRLPGISFNRDINVDESQVMAHAMALAQDPVYQRSVDGATLGPITNYLPLLLTSLGRPFDYTTARLTGLWLLLLAIGFFYASLREVVSANAARIATLVCVAFWGFTQTSDFVFFSSEQPTLPFITASVWLSLRLVRTRRRWSLTAVGLGLLAGTLPYTKLQPLPVLAGLLLVMGWFIIRELGWRNAYKPLVLMAIGGCLPTGIVFGLAAWFGVAEDVYTYYFLVNLVSYSSTYAHLPLVNAPIWERLANLPAFASRYPDTLVYGEVGLAVLALALVSSGRTSLRQRYQYISGWPVALVTVVLAGAWASIMIPGTQFGHHLQLLVFPLAWVAGLGLHLLPDRITRSWRPLAVLGGLMLGAQSLVFLYPTGYASARHVLPVAVAESLPDRWLYWTNPYLYSFPHTRTITISPMAQLAKQYSRPDDQLAVWGWSCYYFIETGLRQGVRDAECARLLIANDWQQRHIDRYARDLRQNQPAIFIDAANERFGNAYRPENYPVIAAVIRQQYALVNSMNGTRLFVLRSRVSRP